MALTHTPPWLDTSQYIKLRLEEAVQEAELALKFLDQGLHRNASGKVFQAWKAMISAAAAKNRELIARHYTGVVKDRTGRVRSRADIIIALMPTIRLREVASMLEEVYGRELIHLTDIALNLHEFQYNGLDPESIVSRYTNLNDVEKDIKYLVEKTIEWVKRLSQT
ncbi:MAG: PaREP1 family protein [Caldivirga sp.]|nr:PaREP1 family protein [Caldivirga sp.]